MNRIIRILLSWGMACTLALASPQAATKTKSDAKAADQKSSQPASSNKIDLNSASQKDLEALPGVGTATAKKIIAGRPYASVTDLQKSGVSAKTIEKITPMVSAGGSTPSLDSSAKGAKAGAAGTSGVPQTSQQNSQSAASSGAGAGKTSDSAKSSPGSGAAPSSSSQASPTRAASPGAMARNTSTDSGAAQQPPQPGMVWANLDTKVYHMPGQRWYGKTKHGKFMTEDDAVKAGFRAAKEKE